MFTETFARDRHIEELRAELRATIDAQEAAEITAELDDLLFIIIERQGDAETI